jgi:two-component system, chemotaxis family, chemotaxis protein CheY
MRMLIVDDNMMMRQMLAAQVGAMGYTDISKAVHGVDAMSQLIDSHEKGTPFDLLLLDWNMPEMNGLDFLIKARNDKRFDKTAIVMITAEGEQQSIVKALEAGATSYLVKPFTPQALQEKIAQVVKWLDTTRNGTQAKTHAS